MPGDSVLEATPLVVDGVMYTTQPGVVVALDARTGRQIWRYTRQQKVKNPYEINPFNRGVAIAGNRLFVGTLDAALIALDARTGRLLWETQVADTMLGYSLTSAPLVVKDKVIVGITGGEFGARGFLDAYDAATGQRLWRWYSVPAAGRVRQRHVERRQLAARRQPDVADRLVRSGSQSRLLDGRQSRPADRSIRARRARQPVQRFGRRDRSGDRARASGTFSSRRTTVTTGIRARRVVLVDRVWHGQMRKLLLHADRNGMFYVLDRTDGRFLSATPFVYQNWNTGFDAGGRPIVVPGSNSSAEGSFFVYPSLVGGTNFQAPSYSPAHRLAVSAVPRERSGVRQRAAAIRGGPPVHRQRTARRRARRRNRASRPPSAGIKALDPRPARRCGTSRSSRAR